MANHASAKATRHCYSQVNSPVLLGLKSARGANRPSGAVDDSDSPAEKTKVLVRNWDPGGATRSSVSNTLESKADRADLEGFSLRIVTLYCLDKKMRLDRHGPTR
jgi:hypothetical protein